MDGRTSTCMPDGEKIRAFRVERGLTQEEMAKEAKCLKRRIAKSSISRAERGQPISATTLQTIARVLDKDPRTLVLRPDCCSSAAPTESRVMGGGVVPPNERDRSRPQVNNAPPRPSLVIGREQDINDLKGRLGVRRHGSEEAQPPTPVVMQGWPGVGKSTLVAALAHDPDIERYFPDGVLWASLGRDPDVLSELVSWGRMLGDTNIGQAKTIKEASERLVELLRDKRMLLTVDDVWELGQGAAFLVGGRCCATLVTTRLPRLAEAIAPVPDAMYVLPVLEGGCSLELLRTLAPEVVEAKPSECCELARDLEGLPLSLQVAGHLLKTESRLGWGVEDLLVELKEESKILEASAPADCVDLVSQTTPTVVALLRKSTDRLDGSIHRYFAMLGPFAPKPATFTSAAMAAVWNVSNPKPVIRELVGRGLLEPVSNGRFQMHSLLVAHAKSLLAK